MSDIEVSQYSCGSYEYPIDVINLDHRSQWLRHVLRMSQKVSRRTFFHCGGETYR